MNRQAGKNETVRPVLKIHTLSKHLYDMKFIPVCAKADKHPVVTDFRAFLNFVFPAVNIDEEENFLSDSDESLIFQQISIRDPFYLEFFVTVAINLKLVKKSKGVHVMRLTATDAIADFAALSDSEIFDKIVKEAVNICQKNISEIMPGYTIPIKDDFIENLIKNPVPTSKIISQVYQLILESFQSLMENGVDFEISSPVFGGKKSSSGITENDIYDLFTSGSYILNAFFVKYFFATFGDYLHIISPFYDTQFSFKDFQRFVMSGFRDYEADYFEPCSKYFLTPLGLEYFKAEMPADMELFANTKIPVQNLFDILPSPFGKDGHSVIDVIRQYSKPSGVCAYKLKITSESNPQMWKVMECADFITLENLHFLIGEEFFLESPEKYSFNTDLSMNKFTEYTPPENKARHKKTNQTKLKDLPLQEKTVFYYLIERRIFQIFSGEEISKNDKFEIEVLKIKNPTGIELYPRVSKEGQGFKEYNFLFD
jgi:hypothetical protein